MIAVTLWHVPENRDPAATAPIDVTGGALVTLGLIGLTYGLIEGPGGHWTEPLVLAGLFGGLALLAAFLWWEHRTPSPMLPLNLFASGQFTSANVVTFVVYGGIGGALFLLPIQLQEVSGYTALASGIALLPVTAIALALSQRSGALADKIGPRLQMSVGPVLVGVGLGLFTLITASGNYFTEVLPGVVVFGFGLAVAVAPLTSTVLAAVPAEHAGMASAVNNDVARAAALIAVALLPAAGGLTRGRLPAPGGVLGRVPHRVADRGRAVRGRWRAGCGHHPQPVPGQGDGGGRDAAWAAAALRAGAPRRRPEPGTGLRDQDEAAGDGRSSSSRCAWTTSASGSVVVAARSSPSQQAGQLGDVGPGLRSGRWNARPAGEKPVTVFSANRLRTGTLARSPATAPKTTTRPNGASSPMPACSIVAAHRLQDHVDAARRGRAHLVGPVGLGVVDGDVGAQFLEEVELGRSPRWR